MPIPNPHLEAWRVIRGAQRGAALGELQAALVAIRSGNATAAANAAQTVHAAIAAERPRIPLNLALCTVTMREFYGAAGSGARDETAAALTAILEGTVPQARAAAEAAAQQIGAGGGGGRAR